MSWHKEASEIELRRHLSKQQGGEESIANHHGKGRLTVRERIEELVSEDSFEEHGEGAGFAEKDDAGAIADFTPANYVIGFGDVDGLRLEVRTSLSRVVRRTVRGSVRVSTPRNLPSSLRCP